MRIYVASSWRNEAQPEVVERLRFQGHEVYDFKDADGFSWKEITEEPPEEWGTIRWLSALHHPAAQRGFARDMSALATAHACILVLPSGRSAHLEAGWAIGRGVRTAVYVAEYDTPDLMVKMADLVTGNLEHLLDWAGWA